MKARQVLFIGGTLNGKMRDIVNGYNDFSVKRLSAAYIPTGISMEETPEEFEMHIEHYTQLGSFESVFVCDDLPKQDAINRITDLIFRGRTE